VAIYIAAMGEAGGVRAVSRREFVKRGAALSAVAMGGRLLGPMSAAPARAQAAAAAGNLPSAGQIREDFQRMVDFGPRLTGTPAHEKFIDWVQGELERAGCLIYPRDQKPFTYWNARRWGLDLVGGATPSPVKISSYFPRSGETPEAGITGKLVSAAQQDQIAGNIVLIDPKLPPQLTESFLLSEANYFHWTGHQPDPSRDYKRVWVATVGASNVLQQYQDMGAIGAVFILDASEAAAAGAYVPFNAGFYKCPALWVDRATGAALTQAALTTPEVRLTLTAEKRKTTSPSIVGVLPGASDEVMVVNTHTDGQNAFEENAAVTLVHLARHFSALPAGKRLKRSLVFSAVTGHMTGELPQTQGFVNDHPDLIAAAAAGMTIEHYGSAEWVDDATGFHATGDPEGCGLWTSESGVLQPVIDSLTTDDIPHTFVLRPKPLYLGIGGALYDAGVPGSSFIAGPNHLVNIVPNGHMDKLDAALAARQTRWTANLLTTFDGMTAADLMRGDVQVTRPSLGPHRPFPARAPGAPTPPTADCLPSSTTLGADGAGPARLGRTPRQLRAAKIRPQSRAKGVFRYCVDGTRGRVSAIVDRGRVRLVTSTIPADRPPLARFPRRRRLARGLFRARPSGNAVAGVRKGKVSFLGVTDRAGIRDVRLLRALLRRAGL
jgi:hypothetical protein